MSTPRGITVSAGQTSAFDFVARDAGGAPINLAGATIVVVFRATTNSPAVFFTCSTANGAVAILSAVAGTYRITIDASLTASLGTPSQGVYETTINGTMTQTAPRQERKESRQSTITAA